MPVSLLLVDDEKALLALLKRYLERQGYAVELCAEGREAVRMVAAEPGRFDIVVLDLGLPDMPGEKVLPQLLDASPQVRVLVASGTPFSAEMLPEAHRPRVATLLKPFVPRMLEDALKALQ
jgi:DNA-binding response OmpR family regulator